MADFSFSLISFATSLIIILITITFHEYAHAKVADLLGDPTPRLAGRLTLNPLNHIDPLGLLMLILVRFGWAKPVPINPYNFRDPKTGSIYVSLAGPLANFLIAWVVAIVYRNMPGAGGGALLSSILTYTIWINLALGVFNLIPIPPLDGSHLLEGLLPYRYRETYYQLQQYGFIFIVMIVVFGGPLLVAIIDFLYHLLV